MILSIVFKEKHQVKQFSGLSMHGTHLYGEVSGFDCHLILLTVKKLLKFQQRLV
jgi:hypothetical protein